jgi:hypothetical protein
MPPKRRTQRNRQEESVNREARGENAPPQPPPPPPVMPGVAELVAQTNQLIATVLARLPPQNEHGEPREHRETIGCTSANFFRHNSPTFDGIAGPIAADHWLNGIQRLMVALKCIDEQKVNYAGLKLIGEAEYWWMSKQAMLITELGEDVPITWERFKQEFNDRFFPLEQRQLRAREFLELTQGDMNVEQPTYPAKRQAIGSSSGAATKRIIHNQIRVQGPYVQHVGGHTSVSAVLQPGAVFDVARLATMPITVR